MAVWMLALIEDRHAVGKSTKKVRTKAIGFRIVRASAANALFLKHKKQCDEAKNAKLSTQVWGLNLRIASDLAAIQRSMRHMP